jgi:serine protease AprX
MRDRQTKEGSHAEFSEYSMMTNQLRAGSAVSRSRAIAALAAITMLFSLASTANATAGDNGPTVDVIVTETNPVSDLAEAIVSSAGGVITSHLDLIGGFSATVPELALATLASDPSIASVTPDGSVTLTEAGWSDAADLGNLNPKDFGGSLFRITEITKVRDFWSKGFTGAGVDVALIDSGVSPVVGLHDPGKLVNGPDLSFESQNTEFRHLDTYGHGTHMAGIIAGRDVVAADYNTVVADHFVGIAPDARIVNVKVGNHDGTVDVSQVIAGIDWVVQHKNDNGLNIRVLNLSFGTDSSQSHLLDPLSHAVEQAWKAGIVVVVAAGNDGNADPLRNPATNPYVIAVGSAEGMKADSASMEIVSDFSNCGVTGGRTVDLVTRGRSVLSLRTPGSMADTENPQARVAGRLFLGSGTSQAAAVVSGLAALLVDQHPGLSPDQVKSMLTTGNLSVKKSSKQCQGAGGAILQLKESIPTFTQVHVPSTGLGSLEAARGTDHLEAHGVVLEGEQDVFGQPWNAEVWAPASAAGTSWSGGTWNGTSWSGTSWSGLSWSGTSWSGLSWSGTSWSGTSWSDMAWSGTSWSGTSWSGTSWSGTSWSGTSWSSAGWDAASGVRWD